METADYVFVVLIYRNPGDLSGFLSSLDRVEGTCRVVVVNSFYDEKSRAGAEAVCRGHGCAFLNVENRGYGAGNNAGIAYARAHYRFSYLVVSNPDIEIEALPKTVLGAAGSAVLLGPLVKTDGGKRQNPYMPAFSAFRERLMRHYAAHPRALWAFYAAVALNKTHRILFNAFRGGREGRVYALHGSFLLFSAPALEKLAPPFDTRMFLFREEDHLARRAKRLGIPMVYRPDIRVRHHEDGSVRFLDQKVQRIALDSLRVYFGLKR